MKQSSRAERRMFGDWMFRCGALIGLPIGAWIVGHGWLYVWLGMAVLAIYALLGIVYSTWQMVRAGGARNV